MLWKIVFQWVHEERMDDDQEYKVGPAPDQMKISNRKQPD